MNPVVFKSLSLSSKTQFLWADGVYLFSRHLPSQHIELFYLFGFFVEVHFEEQSHQIEKVHMVPDANHIYEHYLRHYGIEDFY